MCGIAARHPSHDSRPIPITSNATLQSVAVLAVLAHIAVIIACWLSPSGPKALFLLNAIIACGVVISAISRARYIVSAADWPYLIFIGFELLVLVAAAFALRGQQMASIVSYVVFALHCLATLATVVYAFAFKMRLM